MSIEINDTNFPNGSFRTFISQFDTNGDGWLSDEEIAAVTSIEIQNGSGYNYTGIQFFTELVSLTTNSGSYEGVSLSPLKKLETLSITGRYGGSGVSKTDWDFSENPALEDLRLDSVIITRIVLNAAIENLYIKSGAAGVLTFFALDVSNCTRIKTIEILGNSMNPCNSISGLNNKTELISFNSPVTLCSTLDFSGDTALKTINVNNTDTLVSFSLEGCSALEELNISGCEDLTGILDLRDMPELQELSCAVSGFTSILLGQKNDLSVFRYYVPKSKPAIAEINISQCPQIINVINTISPVHMQYTSGGVNEMDYYQYSDSPALVDRDYRTTFVTEAIPEYVDIVITSFDEYNGCGNVLQFDFACCLSTKYRMNPTDTTEGGYGASEMKTVTLPALAEALPDWIKTRLKTFSVPTSAGSGSAEIVQVTNNKLALRSEVEVYGSPSFSAPGEGTAISYYTDSAHRVKTLGVAGESTSWWSRSPYKAQVWPEHDLDYFCLIPGASIRAGSTQGVAPFGCL